ncbi:YveK family protein [Bacillus alkalicellulosilyticus]|uniref:YveK family protein n=1 Tax=Alkalihalobacterium alkalicellulosilyticum TaxID=1912214 RepID=UPI00148298A6|nr:Wzz/FepE/Etk N-terminal domain-containing protein [Bacillus alkalicellulosilyticus]
MSIEQGSKAKEIDLKNIFNVIKKRFWIVILVTTISAMACWYYTSKGPIPIYETSARIIIPENNNYINTLLVVLKEPAVLERVIAELELNYSVEGLRNQIYAQRIDESQVVTIGAYHTDPTLAQSIANTTATIYIEEVVKILNFKGIELLSEAREPTYPMNIRDNTKIWIVAIAFGVAAGVGLIFLVDSLDNTVKTERELEKLLGVPVFGRVSKITRRTTSRKQKQTHPIYRGETIGS